MTAHGKRLEPARPARYQGKSICLVILLAVLGNGCSLVRNTVETPFRGMGALFSFGESRTGPDPVELQEDLLRFSDNLTSAAIGASRSLEKNGQAIPRKELLGIWIAIASDVLATATGSNSLGSLVDMIVLTSAARIRVEEFWMPKVYGESAKPALEAFRGREREIWLLAEKALTAQQREELRNAIEHWRKEARQQNAVISAFASISLVAEISRSGKAQASIRSNSVFSLLDLDPLAGLDPATRELAQTRLLAERAMFIGQRMPQIIQWQAELLTIRAAELPQVEQALSNTARFADAGQRMGKLAEDLPGLVSSERRAIFQALAQERAKLLAGLGEHEPGLSNLSREIASAFGEGARMANSADAALKAFDSVMARFDRENPQEAPSGQTEPFRIRDYGDAASQIGQATEQLTTMLNTLNPFLGPESMGRLADTADAIAANTQIRGKELVDYAFLRGLQLIAAVLVSTLVYRAIIARMIRTG